MLNTFVAGNSGSVRASADAIRHQIAGGVEENAQGWHRSRTGSEPVWEGQAGDAFLDHAGRTGKDADALADLFTRMAGTLTAFADDLDTVRARMEQAETAASEGELIVLRGSMILEPVPFTTPAPKPLFENSPSPQRAANAQEQAQFDAAKALDAKKQAAFAEAQATVSQAREVEKAAHERLQAALNANSDGLAHIGQAGAWSKAAETATSPAAVGLAHAAVTLDKKVTDATRTMFERAIGGGPAAVSAAWSSLSTAQKGDLITDYPQMVGSTNGVPAVTRDQANRSILGSLKANLLNRINSMHPEETVRKIGAKGPEAAQYFRDKEQLEKSLRGLEKLESSLTPGKKFLLDINPQANHRGQVVVASGNPDTANNVLTLVPGTFHDLGDAQSYVDSNDKVLERANQLAPDQNNATIMWGDYQSPANLGEAAFPISGHNATDPLTHFQEGLRATHEGPQQARNTLMGHSYGSTAVGYAVRADHGHFPADDVMFFGSPGVGAEHASDLGMDPHHVWSGTAGKDPIDPATPAVNPFEWGLDWATGEDHQRFGMNPSNPHFAGNILPTDPNGGHGGYWDYDKSRDAMARVMVGQQAGGAHP